MAEIASSCETVEHVLGDEGPLAVPYFQRGYAWQEEHAERLLDDLLRHASGGGSIAWYPLGAIIIQRRAEGDTGSVADGHQRLITLTILLAILRDLESDEARRRRLGRCILGADGQVQFQTLQGTSDLLLAAVQRDGATQGSADELADLSPSEAAIIANRDALRRRIGELSEAGRRELQDFLLTRTKLVVIVVDDEKAARLLFATMHETGLRPESADLLKSRVLGRCSPAMREKAQSIWEGLEAQLGIERMEALLLNVAALKQRVVQSEPPEVAITQAFDIDTAEGAERFVLDHLRPIGTKHVEMLHAGIDAAASPAPVFRRLQYLSWVIRHSTWRMPALLWLVRHGYEHPQTLDFLRRLEALAWMLMIASEDGPRRDRRYLSVMKEIDEGRALEPGGALTISAAEREEVRKALCSVNFVRKPYKLFLLLRLNALHEGDERVTRTPEATVEHIFPQRPGNASKWLANHGDSGESARVRHMLGNLTLLTEREQNLAANADFLDKRAIYVESPFLITRMAGLAQAFGPEDIVRRTEDMAAALIATLGM